MEVALTLFLGASRAYVFGCRIDERTPWANKNNAIGKTSIPRGRDWGYGRTMFSFRCEQHFINEEAFFGWMSKGGYSERRVIPRNQDALRFESQKCRSSRWVFRNWRVPRLLSTMKMTWQPARKLKRSQGQVIDNQCSDVSRLLRCWQLMPYGRF